ALWEAESKRVIYWLEGHRRMITALAFSPNGRYAVSGSEDGTTRLWDLDTAKEYELLDARWDQEITAVCYAPDGKSVMAVGGAGKVRQWSVRTGAAIVKFKRGPDNLCAAACSTDGASVLPNTDCDFT